MGPKRYPLALSLSSATFIKLRAELSDWDLSLSKGALDKWSAIAISYLAWSVSEEAYPEEDVRFWGQGLLSDGSFAPASSNNFFKSWVSSWSFALASSLARAPPAAAKKAKISADRNSFSRDHGILGYRQLID